MMRLKSKTKLITTLVSFLMIGAAAISSTVAFLYTSDDAITNVFIPSQVKTEVVEDIETQPDVKQNVKIANIGDTTAWIRAAVVVTWQDEDGNVYGQMPVAGTDYDIVYNVDETYEAMDKWHPDGGFYYWPVSVAVGDSTGILIKSCTPTQQSITVGTGSNTVTYYLTVEILGSGIQTFQGVTDYMTAWNTAMGVTTP